MYSAGPAPSPWKSQKAVSVNLNPKPNLTLLTL